MKGRKPQNSDQLRRGWTTGACATAATKAALTALLTDIFPDPVTIRLPKGEEPSFALARHGCNGDTAFASIIKDAGDDPDVTHGAEITSTVRLADPGSGVVFRAGEGVGTVTKAGLLIPPGEPAINPVPRQMMRDVVETLCTAHELPPDVVITISVAHGAALAEQTWNPRLGIVGGLSILGTTGIVHPFSCSAWIHSIHRGVDVARAAGLEHIAGSTGSTSEAAVQRHFELSTIALIDMGDFVGGLLKYVRAHPVPRLTVAGGFAKLTKMAQGSLDLHSGRSQVDFNFLAKILEEVGAPAQVLEKTRIANTALEVLSLCDGKGLARKLTGKVAEIARQKGEKVLTVDGRRMTELSIVLVDRNGSILAESSP